MASGRSYNVRYGSKGAYHPKVRPWHSTSADLFDRLKGSVDTPKATSPASSLPEQGGQRTPVDEDSSCGESPLQIRRRTVSHSRAMYSYSHLSRYCMDFLLVNNFTCWMAIITFIPKMKILKSNSSVSVNPGSADVPHIQCSMMKKMPTTSFPACVFRETILHYNNQCIACMYIGYCVYVLQYTHSFQLKCIWLLCVNYW